jgi:AcrR family transcriptional regulator
MVELTRKQREIEKRASEILRVARPILVSEGYQALSMDRVAAQMEYAKGTIYNHFPNKEEIVVALAVQSMELRRKLFEKASSVNGSSRLRMMGLGVACEFFTQHCTDDFVLEQWVRNQGIWEKSTEKSQNAVRQGEGRCMSVVAGIVRDGMAAGELQVPESISPEEFVFGFWALNYGSQILTHTSPSLPALGINKPLNAIRVHCSTLLNGFGWKPLMDAETYSTTMTALEETLIPAFWDLKKS